MAGRTMRRPCGATCQKRLDRHLLSYVSYLSGDIWHPYLPDDELLMCPRLRRIRILILAAALVGAGGGMPAFARDHDDAKQAVEAGEIRPYADILNVVKGKLPGEVVDVKLEREAGAWMYELRVLDGKGRLLEIHVDAKSGEIERTKEK
ncbi:PepSY domain-containing protein [Bradyrhizobium guangdongense]